MAQDLVIEQETPADSKDKKEIGRGDYTEGGFMYGYRLHEKSEDFLDYYFSLDTVNAFLKGLMRKKGAQVLDFGSGVGRESDRLKKLLPRSYIVSLDISDEGTRHGKDQMGLNQIQGDINLPPFGTEEFDGIHCKDVLVHIKDKQDFIRNISRMLKRGGLFLLMSAEESYEGFKQFNWDPEELKMMAKNEGLDILKEESHQMKNEDWYLSDHVKRIMLFRKR